MGKKLWQCTNKFLTWTYCKQKCLIKSTQTCLIKTKYRGSHRKRRYLLERFIAKINSSEQTMNHCQHVWSFRTAICYLLSVHIYTWTKSCVTQEKIGRLAWHLLHCTISAFPTSPHQLPSAHSTFAATPLPHLSDTPACLTPPLKPTPLPPRYLPSLPFSPTFPSHSLFLSLHSPPCLPEHPALNLALNPCTQRSVTGQMFWSLAREMLWGELRGARGLDWGPLPGPAVYTKDGRNWCSLDAQVFELTV